MYGRDVRNAKNSFEFDASTTLWRHTIMINKSSSGDGGHRWCCRQCKTKYQSLYFQVKAHFCAIPGQGIDVCLGPNKKGLTKEQIMTYVKEQEDGDMASNRSKERGHPLPKKYLRRPPGSHPFFPMICIEEEKDVDIASNRSKERAHPIVKRSLKKPPGSHPFCPMAYMKEQEDPDMASNNSKERAHPLIKKSLKKSPSGLYQTAAHPFLPLLLSSQENNVLGKRGSLEKALKNEAREAADQSITRCMYANRIPFNIVKSPHWQDMIKAIVNAPSDYVSPCYEKVCSTLSVEEKALIEATFAHDTDSGTDTAIYCGSNEIEPNVDFDAFDEV